MDNFIASFIKDYQIFSASLLGFLGVILTMLANARLQRSQFDRSAVSASNSIRSALRSELTINLRGFELRIAQIKETDSGKQILVQSRIMDSVYKNLLSNIGALTPGESEKIIEAYLLLEELPYRLRILVGLENVGGLDGEFICIPSAHLQTVRKIHESCIPTIEEAITTIDGSYA